MNKFLSTSLAALFLVLAGCGDEHLVDNEANVLKQYVFAGPDGFNGNISNYYDPVDELYVEQGQSLKFYAGFSTGVLIYTDETLQPYYSGLLWRIGENTFNLNSFRYTFTEPGIYDGSLETVDTFGDTLRTNF